MIRIMIADDHAIVRQGLSRVLALTSDLEQVAEVSDGKALLEQLQSVQVDLVLLDMSMPGVSGVELISRLHAAWPELPVLVLSMYGDSHLAASAIKAGAKGYLTKDSEPEMIISAIRHCAAGHHYIHPRLGAKLLLEEKLAADEAPHQRLSSREYQIFLLLARGFSVGLIGEKLHISPKTVSTHKFRIMQKMSMQSISELVRYAVRHQLIDS